jgi:hypothetical protein
VTERTESLIDGPRLKAGVLQTTERLRAHPEKGLIRPYVDTRLIRDVSVEARWEQFGREFSLRSDEPAGRGGQGSGPTAIRYFLSGIAFCLQVWYAKGAALAGCELESVEVRLEASLDMRGEYGLPGSGVQQYLVARASIVSPSPTTMVMEVADEAHRRCPLWHLLVASIPGYRQLLHNGILVVDTVPTDAEREHAADTDEAGDPPRARS